MVCKALCYNLQLDLPLVPEHAVRVQDGVCMARTVAVFHDQMDALHRCSRDKIVSLCVGCDFCQVGPRGHHWKSPFGFPFVARICVVEVFHKNVGLCMSVGFQGDKCQSLFQKKNDIVMYYSEMMNTILPSQNACGSPARTEVLAPKDPWRRVCVWQFRPLPRLTATTVRRTKSLTDSKAHT